MNDASLDPRIEPPQRSKISELASDQDGGAAPVTGYSQNENKGHQALPLASGLFSKLREDTAGMTDIVSSLLSWRLLHPVLPSECERAAQGSQGVATGLVCVVSLFNSLCPARAAGWLVNWLPFNTDHHLQVNQMLPVRRTVQPRKLYWTSLTGEPQKCQNYWKKKKKKLDRRWWYRKFSWEVGGLFSVEMQQRVLKWLLSSNIHLEAPATGRHSKSVTEKHI